jgi:hypothetical protein
MGTYKNNAKHFCGRLEERFGITTRNKAARLAVAKEVGNIIRKKRLNEPGSSVRISNTRTLHKINFRGTDMLVIYCKNKKVPVTVLPKEEKIENFMT